MRHSFVARFHSQWLGSVFSTLALLLLTTVCATSGSQNLRSSALQLDEVSSRFSQDARYEGDDGYRGRVSHDAEGLARAADGFNRAIHESGSRDEVEEQYRRVVDRYNQLHEGLAAEGYAEQSRHLLGSFDDVTSAYRKVQGAMSTRFASERDSRHY
jgi:hypothetical protein